MKTEERYIRNCHLSGLATQNFFQPNSTEQQKKKQFSASLQLVRAKRWQDPDTCFNVGTSL